VQIERSVLIADDEPMLLKILSRVLKRMGLNVIAVEDGEAAVNVIDRQSEDVHLVVLDLNMPVMDGAAAFHAISELKPDIPVLISSGDGREHVLSRLNMQPAGIISKPYNLNDLRQIISDNIS